MQSFLLVQVVVKGAAKSSREARVHVIKRSSGLKVLARSVARQSRTSIVRQVMRDARMREQVLDILKRDMQREMTVMSARKTGESVT